VFKCGFCGKEFETAIERMEHERGCYAEQNGKRREETAKKWQKDRDESWKGVNAAYQNYLEVRAEHERKFSTRETANNLEALLGIFGL